MAQCSDCLFQAWNESYADLLPMEFADGKTRSTHVFAALSITDQQEADKLLGDPLSCHVCSAPESHYLTPEVTFPVKTAQSVLKKVLDAAGGGVFAAAQTAHWPLARRTSHLAGHQGRI